MLNIFQGISQQRYQQYFSKLNRDLIHKEAKLGGQLFGDVKKNDRREFFCLDKHTWIWHEEWTDIRGVKQVVTTRYSIRPDGIIKAHNNENYQKVDKKEATNLILAANAYLKHVKAEMY